MVIKKDLSDLPQRAPIDTTRDRVTPSDLWPTREPTVGPALVNAWYKNRTHNDNLPTAIPDAGPFRGSHAAKCAGAIAYGIRGVKETEPDTVAGKWRMGLGSIVHELLQEEIAAVTPGAINELVADLRTVGIPGSMRIDIANPIGYEEDTDTTFYESVEIKTVNGYGFKSMATPFRKTGPEGPRESHVIQACLGAVAIEESDDDSIRCLGARIVYLSLENVSPQLAASIGLGGEEAQFCAEWFIPIEQCREVVAAEKDRLLRVLEVTDRSDTEWVKRVIPVSPLYDADKIMVVNPKTGAAITSEGSGTKTWQCGYCNFQSQCIKDHELKREADAS